VPACIAPYVLKRIGERFAREYFLTGERLTAQKALACGLVNRVVAPQDLDAAVQAYLDAFSAAGPGALAVCKRMVHEVADLDLEKAGPATAEMVARLRASEEGREGMSAFLEGRQPRWAPAREQKG
jgi:methylglutaconyl-CoA hydratase